MIPAVLEKFTFGVAAVLLYTNGRVAGSLVAGGSWIVPLRCSLRWPFRHTRAEQQLSPEGRCGQVCSSGIRGGCGRESSLTSFTLRCPRA